MGDRGPRRRGAEGANDDDRVEGAGRRVVGARDDCTCGAASPASSRSGRLGRSATASPAPRPATACRSTHLDVRFVNDHCYARMRPVGAPEPKPGKPSTPPPDLVLKLLARLHPELRRRTKTARRAIDAEAVARGPPALGGARPTRRCSPPAEPCRPSRSSSSTTTRWSTTSRRTADHLERGIAMHLELIPVHNLPVGRLVLACRSWGIDDAETFALLGGHSPASTASAAGLAAIAARLCGSRCRADDARRRARRRARRPLGPRRLPGRPRVAGGHAVLAERPDPDRAAGPARAGDPRRSEVPTPVPRPRRGRPCATGSRSPTVPASTTCSMTPAGATASRDDNVALTFMWPAGLVRRALLECGRRLAARGLLAHEAHVFALGEDEIAECPGRRHRPVRGRRAPGPHASKRPMPTAHPCTSATTRAHRPTPGCSRRPWPSCSGRSSSSSSSRPPCRASAGAEAALVRRRHRDRHRALHRPSVRRRRRRGRARPAAGRRRPRHHTDDPGLRSGHADRRRRW